MPIPAWLCVAFRSIKYRTTRGGIDDSSCSTQKAFTQRDGGMADTARFYPAGRSGAAFRKSDNVRFGRRFSQVRFWEINLP